MNFIHKPRSIIILLRVVEEPRAMSKLAIILCIVLFAFATHAIYPQASLVKARQRVRNNIERQIIMTNTSFYVGLQQAAEFAEELIEATTRYNETVTDQLIGPILKNARNEIENLTWFYGNDFVGCKNLVADLNGLEELAINITSVCIEDKLNLAFTILKNMIKDRDDIMEHLGGLKMDLDNCDIVNDGNYDRATKCIKSVAADNIEISSNKKPLIAMNLAILTNAMNNIETSLTECTTNGLNYFVGETTNVLAWIKQCIVQHTNEFRVIGLPINRDTVTIKPISEPVSKIQPIIESISEINPFGVLIRVYDNARKKKSIPLRACESPVLPTEPDCIFRLNGMSKLSNQIT